MICTRPCDCREVVARQSEPQNGAGKDPAPELIHLQSSCRAFKFMPPACLIAPEDWLEPQAQWALTPSSQRMSKTGLLQWQRLHPSLP